MTSGRAVKSIAVVVFGLLVPCVLLFQAYVSLGSLKDDVSAQVRANEVINNFQKIRPHLRGANDFALYSMMAAEYTNQSVVTNKQIMKISVMQIGFSVVSLGLMFVILGINDGGSSASMAGFGLSFDFKTGSAGALVFTIGAAMAAAGGILKNDYQTVPVPTFDNVNVNSDRMFGRAKAAYEECKKLGGLASEECFFKIFPQLEEPEN